MTEDMNALPAQSRPVRFAVLMPWGRVGSNVLMAGIGSANVKVANEPTTVIRTHGTAAGLSREAIRDEQTGHLETFFDEMTPDLEAAGVKIAYRSLVDPQDYLSRLLALDARLIVMVRSNFLKCAVSQVRALQRAAAEEQNSGPWKSPWAVVSEEPKPGPTMIDTDEVIRLTRVFEEFHARTLRDVEAVFGADYQLIEYETLRQSPQDTIRSAMAYLGLPETQEVHVRHRKATSDALDEDILNYPEFEKAVLAAGLGDFLKSAAEGSG